MEFLFKRSSRRRVEHQKRNECMFLDFIIYSIYLLSAHNTKFCIILFERAFKMMKNGVYFIVIALLVAELFKILIYAN